MRILGFDTATRATSVALCDLDGSLRLEVRDDPAAGERPGHVTRLMPLIVDVLERGSTTWNELDRIAVGVGPGTFTGLRIGIATARALARARTIPLVGVSTLESLALGATPSPADAILAVLDARRGEVFAAVWRTGASELGEQLLPQRALRPDDLARQISGLGADVVAVGDGAVEFRAVLERSGASVPDDESELHRVIATNHCRLAGGSAASAPEEIHPEYLRLPDAELARRAADSR